MNKNTIIDISVVNWSLFDNYTFNFDISKHGLLVIDTNGSGKTSILNAILLLLCGYTAENQALKSFINSDRNYFKLESESLNSSLIYAINSQSGHYAKKIKNQINKKLDFNFEIFVYLSKYNNWLELERVKKLALFDGFLSQVSNHEYKYNLSLLNKYLKSKSALIAKYNKLYKKSLSESKLFSIVDIDNSDLILLDNLNKLIVSSSSIIWSIRDVFFAFLINKLPKYQNLVDTKIDKVALRIYKSDFNGNRNPFFEVTNKINEKNNLLRLKQLFLREIATNRNLFGAQRDDFEIEINGKKIYSMLSNGENRLFVLFFVYQFISIYKINNPSVKIWWFLDDVFNELDSQRETKVFDTLLKDIDFWLVTGTKLPEFYKKNKSNILLTSMNKTR